MRWDQVEEGDTLVSETGWLVWLVTEKGERSLELRDLDDLSSGLVMRSNHEVTDSFTVLRGSTVLQEGDPASIHKTYK